MNVLYSLLQNAVDKDLNAYLYVSDLYNHPDPMAIFSRINSSVDDLVGDGKNIDALLKQHRIPVCISERKHLEHVHAQMIYEGESQAIWINPLWLERYARYMSKESALSIHVGHELYHVLEIKHQDFWYGDLPYKLKSQVSEVSALFFSQKVAELSYHPRLYEYRYGIDEGEYSLDEVINSMKEGIK